MGRVGTGLTGATIPLVIATAFAAADKRCPAIIFGALAALIVLATFASRLPLLHRLPLIGAVQLTVRFRANGAPEPRTGSEREEIVLTVGTGGFPISVLVEVGIENCSGQDATHALVNVGCPVGLDRKLCDGWGRLMDRGQAMLPTRDGIDYQAISDVRFTGKDSSLIYFRMRVRKPGAYLTYITVSSRGLYREFTKFCEVRILEAEDGSPRDRLGPLIETGEEVAHSGADGFQGSDGVRNALMTFTLSAHQLLLELDRQDLIDRFTDAEIDYVGAETGDEYYRALAVARTKVLYEIRNELGHLED